MAQEFSIAASQPNHRRALPLYARRFRRWHLWIVLAIFILSVIHRIAGLGAIPAPGETSDEISHVWAGLSLLSGDPPRSWTQLDLPPDYLLGHLDPAHQGFSIVRPAFDHPPLFHLLVGTAAHLSGATPFSITLTNPANTITLWDVSLWRLRWLSLVLYMLSFWLMWKWLRLAIGPAAACVAIILFAFLENFTIHHRLVISDNLVTPLLLFVMLSLERWRRGWLSPRKAGLYVAVAIALAVTAKLIALAVVAAVFAWSAASFRGARALRPCRWAITGTAGGIIAIVSYAAIYGFDAFIQTMRAQSGRFYDLGGLFDLVRHQPLVHTDATSEWIVGAWLLVALGAATARGSRRGVFAALIGYVAAYIFFVPVDYYGWYLMPMAPFLCAAWGFALRGAWRRPSAVSSTFVILLLIAAALNPLFANSPELRTAGRYAYLAVAVLMLFPWGFKFDDLRKAAIRILILALVLIGLSQEITRLIALQLQTDL